MAVVLVVPSETSNLGRESRRVCAYENLAKSRHASADDAYVLFYAGPVDNGRQVPRGVTSTVQYYDGL